MLCFRDITRKFTSVLTNDLKEYTKARSETKIIVVGAGLAGLSAASHLINHGFRNTILLEATNRVGGRINTKEFGDSLCELGAKWINKDDSSDSMYELIIEAASLKKQIYKNDVIYINSCGQRINQKIPERAAIAFRALFCDIDFKKKYKTGSLHCLNNVHSYFHVETTNITKDMFKNNQAIATDIFCILIKDFSNLLGTCLDYVNIEHITNMSKSYFSSLYIPNGLINVPYYVASNIAVSQIKTGRPVGEIKWNGPLLGENNLVGCLDGSSFNADHIICTLPLGVLKNFAGHIFKPSLPQTKLSAINNLGFGNPTKVYLEYDKNLLSWFPKNIRPLWSSKERAKDRNWTKQVTEISKLPKSNRVLEVHVGGSCSDEIEKVSSEEISKSITVILRNCLRNNKIPFPSSVLRSDWNSSSCFLGGKPYFTTTSSVKDVKTLAAPLGGIPILLFAGDATIINGFGCLDGARRSGIREAQRIIEFYNKLTS